METGLPGRTTGAAVGVGVGVVAGRGVGVGVGSGEVLTPERGSFGAGALSIHRDSVNPFDLVPIFRRGHGENQGTFALHAGLTACLVQDDAVLVDYCQVVQVAVRVAAPEPHRDFSASRCGSAEVESECPVGLMSSGYLYSAELQHLQRGRGVGPGRIGRDGRSSWRRGRSGRVGADDRRPYRRWQTPASRPGYRQPRLPGGGET